MGLLKFYFSPSGRVARWEWWVKLVLATAVILVVAGIVDSSGDFEARLWRNTTSTESTDDSDTGTTITTELTKNESWEVGAKGEGIAVLLIALLLAIPAIIVTIKRYHDRNKSGWWVLIAFIPVVGALWQLIECGFLPGTAGTNRFGPDPVARPAMA